ncbi:MAG: hypothetical protein WCW84_13105 [Sulfurimonas sp.]|jgi:hypothetical protein
MIALQVRCGHVEDEVLLPDRVFINENKMAVEPHKDFVISRTKHGKILSKYGDPEWDLSPYKSNSSQVSSIIFSGLKSQAHTEEVKKFLILLMIFGEGRGGSSLSVETLRHYYVSCFMPLSIYATSKGCSITDVLSSSTDIKKYISLHVTNLTKCANLSGFLKFLDGVNNEHSGIHYKMDSFLIKLLGRMSADFLKSFNQTEVVPASILNESLSQRWQQIAEIESNLPKLLPFFGEYLASNYFGAGKAFLNKKEYLGNENFIVWEDAVEKFKIGPLLAKYNVKNRRVFQGFMKAIQGTCKHLIHAYTGMRNGEVLSLKSNCLKMVDNGGTARIIGYTTKLEGHKKQVGWVTTKELTRVIAILNSINEIVAKHHKADLDSLPLLVKTSFFTSTAKINDSIFETGRFQDADQLPLNEMNITITESDIEELELIDYERDWRNDPEFQIGTPWRFQSHQYRRSLAVYAMQSGIVSLGALQIQFKHLFREMTLYYGGGASRAKTLFDIPSNHIAKEMNAIKPELDALAYIKNVIFSDQQLFGAHGTFAENQVKPTIADRGVYLLENRERTIKQFKNGEIAWKETMLGGCIAVDPCNSRLTRSIVACLDCECGVHKKDNLIKAIEKQKGFVAMLDPGSIEYRSELEDLTQLEKYLTVMEKKSHE